MVCMAGPPCLRVEMATPLCFFFQGNRSLRQAKHHLRGTARTLWLFHSFPKHRLLPVSGEPGGDPGGSEGLPAAGQVHVCHKGGGELKTLRIKLLLRFLSEAGHSGIGLGGRHVQAGVWRWGLIVGAGHRYTFSMGLEGSER